MPCHMLAAMLMFDTLFAAGCHYAASCYFRYATLRRLIIFSLFYDYLLPLRYRHFFFRFAAFRFSSSPPGDVYFLRFR